PRAIVVAERKSSLNQLTATFASGRRSLVPLQGLSPVHSPRAWPRRARSRCRNPSTLDRLMCSRSALLVGGLARPVAVAGLSPARPWLPPRYSAAGEAP